MEAELLTARIKDTADICLKTSKPKYLGFLSSSEAAAAQETLSRSICRYSLYGGYDGAERVMLGCFPDWMEDNEFPLASVTFKFREEDSLAHRDFLGSLMALGIRRETVGDILIEKGRAVAFVTEEISGYVLTQIEKIGKVGVTLSEGHTEPLPECDRLAEFSDTATSNRIDCIISALCGLSRSKAAEILNLGLVSVNSAQIQKATKSINAGDIISVRGKGRFLIDSLDGRTKKNRIVINYRKYI